MFFWGERERDIKKKVSTCDLENSGDVGYAVLLTWWVEGKVGNVHEKLLSRILWENFVYVFITF